MSPFPDVVVIGGGVIGLSVGWRCAQAGLSVTLCDPSPGHASSAAAAGLLAPVTEVHYGEQLLLQLALASSEMYPAFVAELEELTGEDVGYERTGTLMVARDSDDVAAIEQLLDYQRSLGLQVERLSSRECRQMEPALSPRIRGGSFVAGDHSVDNRALAAALLTACARTGVELRRQRVERIEVDGTRLVGVRVASDETVSSPRVVLAAGCWSGSLAGVPTDVLPPVRPVKGQLLYLRGMDARLLQHNLRGLDVYIVPRTDGRIVVGATVEEMGFDLRLTAGGVYTLLREAYELVPETAELELLETVVGLRPGSPDNAPILGRSSIEGLIIATGHYRNGILLTPITAASIAELLATGRPPDRIKAFSPARSERESELIP